MGKTVEDVTAAVHSAIPASVTTAQDPIQKALYASGCLCDQCTAYINSVSPISQTTYKALLRLVRTHLMTTSQLISWEVAHHMEALAKIEHVSGALSTLQELHQCVLRRAQSWCPVPAWRGFTWRELVARAVLSVAVRPVAHIAQLIKPLRKRS